MGAPKYLQGDVRPRKVTVATAQAAAIGDVISLITNTAVRGEDIVWDTNLATTQADQAAAFAGISLQQKTANVARIFGNSEDNVLIVGTGGCWEFDCASATFEFGDFVGLAKQAGNALESQKVVSVTTVEADAFGRVIERGTAITRVKIEVLSKMNPAARQT